MTVLMKGVEKMKKYDVIALGELLIDFTQNGMSAQGNPVFEANPGGAPCNVLAMLTKLGHKTAFIGKVGQDAFGRQLKGAIEEVGIRGDFLQMDEKTHTTLAFVQTLPGGDRDFSFYRDPGADMMLEEDELPLEALGDTRIFHFGTLSMTHDKVRQTTKKAVVQAKAGGALVSFDPNLRPPLWPSQEAARTQVLWGLGQCDVLKISDNEIQWLTGCQDFYEGARWIRKQFPEISWIFISMGAEGSLAFYKDMIVSARAFLMENTIETTGAGDTFMGCILHGLLTHTGGDWEEKQIREMLSFANGAAALVTTRRGALRVMPDREEITRLVDSRGGGY